jgi:hypothetical protein
VHHTIWAIATIASFSSISQINSIILPIVVIIVIMSCRNPIYSSFFLKNSKKSSV